MNFAVSTIIFAVAVLLTNPASAQTSTNDSLTLDNAIQLTLTNHPAIQQAQHHLTASGFRLETTRSHLYPDISLTGDYTRVGPVPTFDLPGESIELFPKNNYDLHLGLRQMLYDFGRNQTKIKAAVSSRQAEGDNIDLVKSTLVYQTIATFNAILILERNITVLDEQIAALNEHLEVSNKKVRAGTATDYDILTTQVRIANFRDQKLETKQSLDNQEILFRQITGVSSEQPIYLKGDFVMESVLLDEDSLLALAQKQRPELVLCRDAESNSVIQFELASLGSKPTLSLNFTSGFKNGYIPNLNTIKGNYTAGLLLEMPIYEGKRTRFQTNEAESNVNAAKAHSRDVQQQVIAEVRQAVAGVKSSLERIANSQVQLSQAVEALSMAKTRYAAGVITNLDLLDAETALSQAKLISQKALYNYTVSLNALDKATGKRFW